MTLVSLQTSREHLPFTRAWLACCAILALCLAAGCAANGSGGSGVADTAAGDSAKPDVAITPADAAIVDGAKGDGATPAADAVADTAKPGADVPQQDTGVKPDEVAKQLADAKKAEGELYTSFCKLNFVCDTGYEWTNTQACAAELAATGGLNFFANGMAAIAAGRAKFAPATLAACVATLDSKCTFFTPPLPQPCQALFVGLVDAGFGCDRDEDCKDKFCQRKAANDLACQGLCAAPAKAGANCDTDAGCVAPNVCLEAGKCGAYTLVGKGQDCTDVDCLAGLVCISQGETYVCAEPAGEGAPCYVDDNACKLELYCLTSKVDEQGKCTKRVASGKVCDLQGWFDGLSERPCGQDLVCAELSKDATQATCTPYVPLGKPCVAADQCKGKDEECSGPAEGQFTCNYVPSKGEACEPLEQEWLDAGYVDCLPPAVCDDKSSKCVDLPAPGKACIAGRCAHAAWCETTAAGKEVCAAYGKVGEPCTIFIEEASSCNVGLICEIKGEKCALPLCQ